MRATKGEENDSSTRAVSQRSSMECLYFLISIEAATIMVSIRYGAKMSNYRHWTLEI